MSKIDKQFTDILDSLTHEKRNINQLYLTSVHTITELHKTNAYVEQLKAILARLYKLLQKNEHLKNSKDFNIENKEYAKLINEIHVEYRYLISTNEAMNDNLSEIEKTEGICTKISGKMICMKKDIDKVIRKFNKVLNLQDIWH